jgi:hypothetical protein
VIVDRLSSGPQLLKAKVEALHPTAVLAAPRPAVAAHVTAAKVDSLTVAGFPPLLEEFRTKRFHLLWLGSRDGSAPRISAVAAAAAKTLWL